MKNNKKSEILKMAMVSVLSIGLFSMAFIGVNNIVFAAATSKAESIPSVAKPVNNIPPSSVLPEGYQKPALTVYESSDSHTKNSNVLSKEEAVEIGAQYIWEMFGENINGKTVEMDYRAYPSHTRTWWSGAVADSKSDLENHEAIFRFTLDAISGERIDISKDQYEHSLNKDDEKTITFEEVEQLKETYKNQNHDEYIRVAIEYAQKHFTNSKVVNAIYHSMSPIGSKDNDKITYNPKDNVMNFIITDDTGREANVSIEIETKQLRNISTQENDFVPGFNAELPGSVG